MQILRSSRRSWRQPGKVEEKVAKEQKTKILWVRSLELCRGNVWLETANQTEVIYQVRSGAEGHTTNLTSIPPEIPSNIQLATF